MEKKVVIVEEERGREKEKGVEERKEETREM